ncbi:NADH-quinone oxidoreductase subunit J [Coxiella endosymbiont of Amblyomma nuttalli]|uniref:NADH-quinone oxidoreductase subunit J n=1 Tax=Coxiella endosymbiont of Amblyomma nuttalli TaxID=2749996 RepID=UPI001BA4CFB2|nr:NADH-quinone oxidoreductase subunit J [Coxiella endosymbiont of Amblyomma nuttalli]QTS83676.1 NADH-quinone oxidoreductase subunit J [Coxiella endosymbiont of Amblyomma nuttalli]
MFPVYEVMFFIFAIVLVAAATMVIVSRNSVHAVLFLVFTAFMSAVLWMMIQAEFLSLVLIFVYVGAVMTLFLFIVMMLNVRPVKIQKRFVRFLLFGLFSILLFTVTMIITVRPQHFGASSTLLPRVLPANFSNAKAIGILLYTHYLLPFEIGAVILLVSIIAAITLALQKRKSDAKSQRISEQLGTTKENRLRIIKMKVEKP